MHTTAREKKYGKLRAVLGKAGARAFETSLLDVLRKYNVRSRTDFYFSVVKSGDGEPRLLKVSHNYDLRDPLKRPLGAFDLTGMVVDASTMEVLYPGMTAPQWIDRSQVENYLGDMFLRCEGWLNPPECSPLITMFCTPYNRAVYAQVESSRIVKRINHALVAVPSFVDYFQPIYEACAEMDDRGTVEDTVYAVLFERAPGAVLSVRTVWEGGYTHLYVEKIVMKTEGVWVCSEPGEYERWVNLVLGAREWDKVQEIHYPPKTPQTERVIRVVPEEVDTTGVWHSYVYVAPAYYDQLFVQSTPMTFLTDSEHFIDNLPCPDGGQRELSMRIERRTIDLLSAHPGVWYHWNNVGFPLTLLWNNEGSGLNMFVTRREINLCLRIFSYYSYTPMNFREQVVEEVAEYFVARALLCDRLYRTTDFDNHKTPGAKKFAIASHVSKLPWVKVKGCTPKQTPQQQE
jgi:hypothetical protein